jgi:site-specific recombinase XerD
MYEALYTRQNAIDRHLGAPLLQERLSYLKHCARLGATRNTLAQISIYLLVIVEGLHLSRKRNVRREEVEAAAARRSHLRTRLLHRTSLIESSQVHFYRHAVRWLSFLGWLKQEHSSRTSRKVNAFVEYMREERGLSEQTIDARRLHIETLLTEMRRRGHLLSNITPADIDGLLIERYQKGDYSPHTIRLQASELRAFFRFAESHQWCHPGIALSIKAPRCYSLADLPAGPSWKDVQRLLRTTEGEDPTNIRDRAILLLFTVYGMRSGEVVRLCLEDLDWEHETLTVIHSKDGRRQVYPLTWEVGNSILRYLRGVRPQSACREVFLLRRAPIRPMSRSSIYQVVCGRMRALHIDAAHHGPHSLRHACATRLINQGLPLKAIADQLGHRNIEATSIYAKVDLQRLRAVAKIDLRGLL